MMCTLSATKFPPFGQSLCCVHYPLTMGSPAVKNKSGEACILKGFVLFCCKLIENPWNFREEIEWTLFLILVQVVKLFWAIDKTFCANDWRINNARHTSVAEAAHLSVSWSIHHLSCMEGLRASREKSLWCQTSASMGSVTGCYSPLSSAHTHGCGSCQKSFSHFCVHPWC